MFINKKRKRDISLEGKTKFGNLRKTNVCFVAVMRRARRTVTALLVWMLAACLCCGMTEQEALDAVAAQISEARNTNCQAPTIPEVNRTVNGTNCKSNFIVRTTSGKVVSLFDRVSVRDAS